MKATTASLIIAAVLFAAPAVHADESSWILHVGIHDVMPRSDNGTLAGGALTASVGNSVRPTVTIEYRPTQYLGLDLLAAVPFKHNVDLNGVRSATVKQLPPTFTVNYYFMPDASVSPFIGAGLNYTRFFSASTTGPLAGTSLHLGNSWGAALHGGIDFHINDRWLATLDAYWISIRTDASVNGVGVGTVKIDPWVVGASVGYRF